MPIDKRPKEYADEVIKEVLKDPRYRGLQLDPRDVSSILRSFGTIVIKAVKAKKVIDLRYFILFPFPKNLSRLQFLQNRKEGRSR